MMRICYFGGLISAAEQMAFNKLLFRATRGKAYVQYYELQIRKEDRILVNSADHQNKYVYIVMFEESGSFFKEKVRKIC